MSGLAHYIEDEGIATVVVALLREHAEKMRPPRALFVPFQLGRPFGSPGDVPLQSDVLSAALALFDRESGPVLDDFDAGPAGVDESADTWVCPISFAAPAGDASIGQRLEQELGQLEPWYELGRERRGGTTVGLLAAPVGESARWLATRADALDEEGFAGHSVVDSLRWSSQDLRSYYFEAASAQPGAEKGAALEAWFWEETTAGELLRAVRTRCLAAEDASVRAVGEFMLGPDAHV